MDQAISLAILPEAGDPPVDRLRQASENLQNFRIDSHAILPTPPQRAFTKDGVAGPSVSCEAGRRLPPRRMPMHASVDLAQPLETLDQRVFGGLGTVQEGEHHRVAWLV